MVRKTRLEVGDTCLNGHNILSSDDLKIYEERHGGKSTGRQRHICRKCQNKRPPDPDAKRQVVMNCGHSLYFRPQAPTANDIILCQLCSEYRVVVRVLRGRVQ